MADESIAPIFDSLDTASSRPVRTPKTAELVALKLRRMIVDGQLADGDRLPHEAELMEHFSVSRPTLREAVRVLESERLVEVRRGSRSGARVCVPGPEIVARPASLLLELSGATVADVLVAREALEPHAARLLALTGSDAEFDELERMVDEDIPASYAADTLSAGSAAFHLRLVQMCGNATLALLAGMMHEIFERHVEAVTAEKNRRDHERYESNFLLLIRSCRRLIKLLRARDADAAYDHWQQHMTVSRGSLLLGHESTQVRDVLD
ncbi:FadR/GntR family transcriptional regulator [Rhodococcus rhodochrous]|uniref:GntR family transcriptional regulator n=1 Tax=Rhodococcus rhodochrous TaxID=1829 RepID=A0AA46X315_RHORH|nr:GntR family transcriptional regulator [Rhodococcus rhodochrous]MCB8913477.1 GntR family transcriptional regulator [Rhodococcus rhodochrous]UZF47982.1 GntR family transcriptional regulator [Rhodococcus rhodochrous]